MKDKATYVLLTGFFASATVSEVQAAGQLDVYGSVGLYAGSIQRSGESRLSRDIFGGGLQTSFIGLKGQQVLGKDLKVLFALESFFRPDLGEMGRNDDDPFFSRNAWLGLEGAFGRVSFGRQTNPTYAVMSQLSPFGSSVVFSPLAVQSFVLPYGRNILGDSVWDDVIKYATPNLRGFQGALLYGRDDDSDGRSYSNRGAHATYRSGKFMGAVSLQRVEGTRKTTLAEPQLAWLAGATYDFGPLRLHGSTVHTRIDGGSSTRLYDVGVSVPVSTAGRLLLETAYSRIDVTNASNIRRTTTSFGYGHQLSRRTDVYAIHTHDQKSSVSAGRSYSVGIRYQF
ncbi:porin [Ectopseudomonas alcaliphila]|uniref:porin n=1 Tax=Ectopseudomonas alcaliphila TaxID=101564 RepID=UPI00278477A4|nr:MULTISPECIES: porin [Pseudomonas]MDP9941241.1 putative porin [Pseudomonas sp. 3400]MDR7013460.1 putative porin [Pseudomonas alcaliphila]